ncbi:MAG: bacterial Ig-like domain-containing protein [Firmicutes bacterium]|nr:bacterial Ig-like domain-containing protein [Bacillota bacterium]
MKKISLLLIIVMALAVSVFAMAACEDPDPIITGINVEGHETLYLQGEAFDRTRGYVVVAYDNDTTRNVPFSDADVSFTGFDSATVRLVPVTANYQGHTYTFHVNIQALTIQSAAVEGHRSTYFINDTLSRDGYIVVTFANNTTERIRLNDNRVSITGFNSSAPATQQRINVSVNLTQGVATAHFYIEVLEAVPVSFAVENYRQVQALGALEFDRGIARAIVTFDNGTTQDWPLDYRFTYTGFNAAVETLNQQVTFSFEGLTYSVNVEIRGGYTPLRIQAGIDNPYNTSFPPMLQNEELIGLSNVVVRINYANGVERMVNFIDEAEITMIFDNMQIGTAVVIVIYYRGATSIMTVRIDKNVVLYINTAGQELAAVNPINATREQRDRAIGAIDLFITELNSNMAGIHEANFNNLVLIAFVNSYNQANANFELASDRVILTGNVPSVSIEGTRDDIDAWIEAMSLFVEAMDDLVLLTQFNILWQGTPISARLTNLVQWFNNAGGSDMIQFVDMFVYAIEIYEMFRGIRLYNADDAMAPAAVAAANQARDFIEDKTMGMARNVFSILNQWNPQIADAMIYVFYRIDDDGQWLTIMENIFIPQAFTRVRSLGDLLFIYFNRQRLFSTVQEHDITVFYALQREFIRAANDLLETTHWFYIEAFHDFPLINTGLTIEHPNQIEGGPVLPRPPLHMALGQLINYVAYGQFVGLFNIGQGTQASAFSLPSDWPLTIILMQGHYQNEYLNNFMDIYFEWILNYGRVTTEQEAQERDRDGWIFDPLSTAIPQFAIDTENFLRELIYLPAQYQYTFFTVLNRWGEDEFLHHNVSDDGLSLDRVMWNELNYFSEFLFGHYNTIFSGPNIVVMLLLQNMLSAIEYNMFATQLVIERQVFIDFVDTNVVAFEAGLTSAARTLFHQHLGFFFDRILDLRELSVRIAADEFNPVHDAYWQNILERLTVYLDALAEAQHRNSMAAQNAPEAYRHRGRIARIAFFASYARIRHLHQYILNNAPDSVLEAYFNHNIHQPRWMWAADHPLQPRATMVTFWASALINNVQAGRSSITGVLSPLGSRGRMTEDLWAVYYAMFDLVWADYAYEFSGTATPVDWVNYTLDQIPLASVANIMLMINNLSVEETYIFFANNNLSVPWQPVFEHNFILETFFDENFGEGHAMTEFAIALVIMEFYIYEYYIFGSQAAVDRILGDLGIVRLRATRAALTGTIDANLLALYNNFVEWVNDLEDRWEEDAA